VIMHAYSVIIGLVFGLLIVLGVESIAYSENVTVTWDGGGNAINWCQLGPQCSPQESWRRHGLACQESARSSSRLFLVFLTSFVWISSCLLQR